MEPLIDFIETILVGDLTAPRKQRHTSHRIYARIVAERPEHEVAESTVRCYVRERRQELGLKSQEVYVPQSCAWSQEAQVDWSEAIAEIAGERRKVYDFAMRSMVGWESTEEEYF